MPLRYEQVFCPEAPPLPLTCRQPVRLLCFADEPDNAAPEGVHADDRGWRGVVLRFVQTFTARDPVALVIRIEPPAEGAAERTLAHVGALLARAGIAAGAPGEPSLPEVLFEATPLPPARRGSIYTAARILLLTGADTNSISATSTNTSTNSNTGGNRNAGADALHSREAVACGLTVAEPGASAADLRRLVADHS